MTLQKFRSRNMVLAICFVCFAGTCCYIVNAVTSWFGEVQNPAEYEGLDATAFLDKSFMSDVEAIRWLNENVEGTAVIVEAQGDSYTDYVGRKNFNRVRFKSKI